MTFCIVFFFLTLCHFGHFSDELIQKINTQKTTWTARELPVSFVKSVQSFQPLSPGYKNNLNQKVSNLAGASIPENFDARTQWADCPSIGNVRDQGRCGACWAFATAEIMSDRYCIGHNGGAFNFAPEELLTCCSECGDCVGGYVDRAMNYFVTNGVVSGGDFNSSAGCKPYSDAAFNSGIQPACSSSCTNKNYASSYLSDKTYADRVYEVNNAIDQIQAEIMESGSVGAMWVVYEDFYYYESGVYQHVTGTLQGYHTIKIIGWGVDNGVPYWLCVNSWGIEWGEAGLFKVIQGKNMCSIESFIYAGKSTALKHVLNVFLLIFTLIYTSLKIIS